MSPVFDEKKYRALLDKLEISIVEFKDTYIDNNIFRVDAEYYKKLYSQLEQKIKSYLWTTLKQLNISLDCSAFYPSVAEDYNFNFIGVPFLRVNEIVDGQLNLSNNTAFLPQELIDKYRSTIKVAYNNDILIAKGGNTAGKVGFVSGKYGSYATCRDLVVLHTDRIAEVNPQTLSLYLQCYFGKCLIERTISQTGQPHLTLPLLERLPIPLFSKEMQNRIKHCVYLSLQNNHNAQTVYNESVQMLLQEFGLFGWQPTNTSMSTKTYEDVESSGRLDAEYYQPKYDELFRRLSKLENVCLGSIVSIKKSIEPGSEAYQDSGIPFIRVSDISKFGITPPSVFLDRSLYYASELTPRKDSILLSKDGSVGIAYKVDRDLDAITSGALLHLTITDQDFLPDYLTLVLNSIVVKLQAERDAGGSIIQHWKPSEIKKVIIPKLSMGFQSEVASKVQESFALRQESKRLLELAKHAVEVAIEQGEETALNLLEEK